MALDGCGVLHRAKIDVLCTSLFNKTGRRLKMQWCNGAMVQWCNGAIVFTPGCYGSLISWHEVDVDLQSC
jgi:hypothetical protein